VHINILDIYHARESFIHQLDPRVKIIATFLIIVTTVLLPEGAWVGQAVLFGLLIVLSLSARLGPFFTIRRAIIALPFLLAALPIPFLTLGPAVWVVPGLGWVVSSYGLIRFMTILVRTWVAVQAGKHPSSSSLSLASWSVTCSFWLMKHCAYSEHVPLAAPSSRE
jgi:cobalt/nickel transport system permease protein